MKNKGERERGGGQIPINIKYTYIILNGFTQSTDGHHKDQRRNVCPCRNLGHSRNRHNSKIRRFNNAIIEFWKNGSRKKKKNKQTVHNCTLHSKQEKIKVGSTAQLLEQVLGQKRQYGILSGAE